MSDYIKKIRTASGDKQIDYEALANKMVTKIIVPEGEIESTGLNMLKDGIYLLQGKFYMYSNPDAQIPQYIAEFKEGVFAFVTTSMDEEDEDIRYTHIWYLNIKAGYDKSVYKSMTFFTDITDPDYCDMVSSERIPLNFLDKIGTKYKEIDDMFFQRLSNKEGREEWFPSIGTMADYVGKTQVVNKASGELISCPDSSEFPFKSMKIFGKTTQDGTPTPENPIQLVSVGDSGSTTEYVKGGNLFDISADTRFTKQEDGSYISNSLITTTKFPLVLPFGTYTYSYDLSCKTGINGRLSVGLKDGSRIELYATSDGSFQHTKNTFTGEVVNWCFVCSNVAGAGEMIIKNLQLGVGSTEKPYEPYKEQSLTIPTPNGLPGIPVSSSSTGNYIDENGQKWVCDEVDFERGVYIKNISSCTFDNNTAISKIEACDTSKGCSEEERRIYITGPANMKRQGNLSDTIISTHYIANGTSVWYGLANAIYISTSSIVLHHFGMTTKELYKEWLSSNPVTIYYELAEPIETPLSEYEEIYYYKALHTNYPNTTIYNSDGAGAEVEYVADTKIYIDNKIADEVAKLTAAIITE